MTSQQAKLIASQAAAIAVMVFSVIFGALFVSGILVTWALNGPIIRIASAPFNLAEEALIRIDGGVQRVNTRFDQTRGTVAAVRQDVVQLSDNFEQNAPILTRINNRLTETFEPQLQAMSEGVTTIREGAAALNAVIDIINTVRFGRANKPDQTIIDRLGTRVDVLEQSVNEALITVNDRRVNRIQGTTSTVTGVIDRVDTRLQDVQTGLTEASSTLNRVRGEVISARNTVVWAINIVSVALAITLGWLVASQVVLFQRARDWYRQLRQPALPSPQAVARLDTPA